MPDAAGFRRYWHGHCSYAVVDRKTDRAGGHEPPLLRRMTVDDSWEAAPDADPSRDHLNKEKSK
ncbi:hypothetical protein BG60_37520 [Caballeronia zhejiangensis]|jgi:hypothetical protein|uniref:Uncharacterized protein n=1 Tax=Caballeronia zhejiangensis TaxID=871203 RepID=A0A656QJ12_9BURK|nr:hypothetical protein BURK_034729 [Burkholderia sp. SJ98]KDR30461.1 hypothetical protein BG60_37520 [Caballeronia zhejiangensis]